MAVYYVDYNASYYMAIRSNLWRLEKMKTQYDISYYSKSDGKKIKRPYNPHHEKQHEFIAGSGNLCKRYWDTSKEGLRTANAPWTITVRK